MVLYVHSTSITLTYQINAQRVNAKTYFMIQTSDISQ